MGGRIYPPQAPSRFSNGPSVFLMLHGSPSIPRVLQCLSPTSACLEQSESNLKKRISFFLINRNPLSEGLTSEY